MKAPWNDEAIESVMSLGCPDEETARAFLDDQERHGLISRTPDGSPRVARAGMELAVRGIAEMLMQAFEMSEPLVLEIPADGPGDDWLVYPADLPGEKPRAAGTIAVPQPLGDPVLN